MSFIGGLLVVRGRQGIVSVSVSACGLLSGSGREVVVAVVVLVVGAVFVVNFFLMSGKVLFCSES